MNKELKKLILNEYKKGYSAKNKLSTITTLIYNFKTYKHIGFKFENQIYLNKYYLFLLGEIERFYFYNNQKDFFKSLEEVLK